MSDVLFAPEARWIWCEQEGRPLNRYVCFRRMLDASGSLTQSILRITTDSRYEVYVNGAWIGHGPQGQGVYHPFIYGCVKFPPLYMNILTQLQEYYCGTGILT